MDEATREKVRMIVFEINHFSDRAPLLKGVVASYFKCNDWLPVRHGSDGKLSLALVERNRVISEEENDILCGDIKIPLDDHSWWARLGECLRDIDRESRPPTPLVRLWFYDEDGCPLHVLTHVAQSVK